MKKIRIVAGAVIDLGGHYLSVFRHAWGLRHEGGCDVYTPFEAQFLPAALSLQESPMSPAPRIAMRLIMLFSGLVLVWSIVGQLEIVTSGQGKILLREGTKTIQSIDAATVRGIHVLEGDFVRQGQLLIELDATAAMADLERIRAELESARLQWAKAEALLLAIRSDRVPPLRLNGLVSRVRINEVSQQAEGQFAEYKAKLTRVDSDIAKREAEWVTTSAIVRKLQQALPSVARRADDYRLLLAKGFVSEHAFLEKEQLRIEMDGDLSSQRSRLNEIQASLNEGRWQRTNVIAEFRRTALDSVNEFTQKIAALEQDHIKAENHNRLLRLTAPVDGQVQQLSVHTVGGVVTSAQPLMLVVPLHRDVEVEVMVENRDIGFVRIDQPAEVKIDAFIYTKYGTVPGKVVSISGDAVNDEKRGLLFSVRVRFERPDIDVEGVRVNLSPGMTVAVEIKTGMRRVIEYFLNPLLQYKRESLKER